MVAVGRLEDKTVVIYGTIAVTLAGFVGALYVLVRKAFESKIRCPI